MRIFLACVLLASAAHGQVAGRLSGLVLDPAGAPIPGASVNVFLADGASAILTGKTTGDGLFAFSSVRPAEYTVAIEAPGFRKETIRNVKVDPGRETALPVIRMEVGSVIEVVEVTASPENVQTSNAEIAVTLTSDFLKKLPTLNRNPMAFILTQAGVSNGRSNTVINGQRTSYSNVTYEGINIQDNFIRTNSLDFQPNLVFQDQVQEMTLVTSNANSASNGGASQVTLSAPSGTNSYHGNVFWSNRNNVFSANTWFNNRDRIPRPFLNQNQFGASIGGPILKDKLLFYFNYEGLRLRQQSSANRTILTADARQGIFTYRDSSGTVRRLNLLAAIPGAAIDPAIQQLISRIPGPEKINNFRVGDSRDDLLRNTAGYSFLIRSNRTRDNTSAKLDYHLSTRHVISGTYAWNGDNVDRPDLVNDYSPIPVAFNDNATNLLSAGWRWTPSPTLTNELRGGFNLAPAVFNVSQAPPSYFLSGLIFSNPINTYEPEGRYTDTYTIRDDAQYIRGKHSLKFGFLHQAVRVEAFDAFDIVPVYGLGIGTGGNVGLTGQSLPGISAADLATANSLLATLNGYISTYSQNFNVTSRTSGFVPNAMNVRNYSLGNLAFYAQDDYKVHPRITLNLGLRWDYYSPVDERDALTLMPLLKNNNPVETLLSNSTLDFAGKAVGRPLWSKDLNNFAPNIGFAWDVFGNGNTALRGGYSINYANDEMILASVNNVDTNDGLNASVFRSNLRGTIRGGLPSIPTPQFKVPRTFADNYNLDTTSPFGMPHPNLRTPYIQQWSLGIQRDLKGNLLEIRYVGNHVTQGWRAFDFNQVVIRENGFLADFQRALNNGNLARAATGVFNPAFNPNLPGSQRLPVFDQLEFGGLLTNPTVRSFIETGQVGELANIYQINELNGAVDFYRNPFALGTNLLTNFSNSTYNGLQVDFRRRLGHLQFDANYTYSKVLSDSIGDIQHRFEALLDKDNPKIEKARAAYDLAHVFNQFATYELPFGPGRRFSRGPVLNRILGGWNLSNVLQWQSGTPFSVISGRATLNRGSRSANTNTANTTLNKSQLDELFGLRFTGSGPYFAAASALGPDGRAVAPDGAAPFSGQAFSNPVPGGLGALQRRMFSGPSAFNLDLGIQKVTRITERQSVELRMDARNVLNHATFFVGDQNINSVNFGRVSSSFYGRRIIQFGLTYRF